jgi:hypothetical protein
VDDQTGHAEYSKVLAHGRAADRECRGDRMHRLIAFVKQLEDSPPHGLPEGIKDLVDGLVTHQ